MSGIIRIERAGALGYLIFDHAQRRNALNAGMWRQIPELAAELDADPAVRVIIMRGAGDEAFVSGADISEFSQLRTGAAAAQYDAENVNAFAALHAVQKPLIALIHGFCIGGGMALASCADLRYAADDAVFAVPAGRLGLGYPLSAAQHLVRLLGQAHAKELFFTARRFRAPDALRLGLVHEVTPKAQLDAYVLEVAEEIARNAPLTLRAFKLAAAELLKPANERNDAAAAAAISECFHSDDYKEGVQAFLDKRTPKFQGH
jgi:enoyl-CoA hydratase/carnithine racemase